MAAVSEGHDSEIDLRAILTPVSNAIHYAKFRSRSHDAVIRVYDDAGNVIRTREHKGDFQRVVRFTLNSPFAVQVCSVQAGRSLSASPQ